MALVPAGCFNMGNATSAGNNDEYPVHNVCLTNDFALDANLVTNAEYARCVAAAVCTAPSSVASSTRGSYYNGADYANFPVIYVTWDQATTYCGWISKRLPTEAEWEYAARGGLDGKTYPNGNKMSRGQGNYHYSKDKYDNDTTPIDFYPDNGYGLHDMAGNVWEFVSDWYASDYYSSSPASDPTGPATGTYRVLRGGAWNVPASYIRVSVRYNTQYAPNNDTGFRCAGVTLIPTGGE